MVRHSLDTFKNIVVMTVATLIASSAFAGSGITYQGRILKPDGTPLAGANVQFKMQIRTPDPNNCLMYEEMQSLDMRNSNGTFAVTMNDGTGTRTDATGLTLDRIFSNAQGTANVFNFNPATCNAGSSYSPSTSDGRAFVVYFKDETMAAYEPMPAQKINFIPLAFEAKQIAGFTPASLVRVAEADGTLGNISPLSNANYTELLSLIGGTSSQYTKQSAAAGTVVSTVGGTGNVATPSAGSVWLDTTAGNLKFYDGSSIKTLGTTGGSVTSVATGTGLTGGPITTTGTISLATLGTGGTGFKVTYDTYGRVTGAVALVEADIPTLTTAGHVSGSAITSGTIAGSTSISTTGTISSGAITSSGLITSPSLSSTAIGTQSVQIFETTNSFKVSITAPASLSANYALTLPTTAGGANQVLTTNGSGVLSWTTPAGTGISALTGDVTASGSGSVAATVAQVGGVTAANVASGANLANAATNLNTASTIVKRDASGNFAASAVTETSTVYKDTGANTVTVSAPTSVTSSYVMKWPSGVAASAGQVLSSDTSGNLSWSSLPTSMAPSGSAGGDLSGSYPNPSVATVGGSTAANINTATIAANAATAVNTASKIVARDASGNFAANVATVNGVALNNAGSVLNITNPVGGAWNMTLPATAGTSGQVMATNGSGVMSWTTPLSSSTAFINGGNSFGANAAIGTNDAFRLDVKTNNAVAMTVDTAGKVGIGTTAPTSNVEIRDLTSGTLTVGNINPTSNPYSTIRVENYRKTWGQGNPQIQSYFARGTLASPTAVQKGDQILSLEGRGYASTTSWSDVVGGSIQMLATSNWNNSVTPTDMVLGTNPSGGQTTAWEAMRLRSNGSVGVGVAVPKGFFEVSPRQYISYGATASQSTNTITGAGTAFTAAMVGSRFSFADGTDAGTITGYTSATSITVSTSQTVASQRFFIGYTGLDIDSTGNVGIGTTSPATKLSVAGTLMIADGGETCGATYAGAVRYNTGNIQFCNGTSWSTLGVAGAGITALTGDVTASGTGSVAATVANVGGVTAANVASGANLANAATNLNTVSALVKRDASGNFSAGAITSTSNVLKDTGANTVTLAAPTSVTTSYSLKFPVAVAASAGQVLASDTSGNMSWSTIPTALPPNGSAGGDLSGSYPNPTVATVGTSTAAQVHSAELAANAATAANTASTIVARDGTGNFAANVATFNGLALKNAGSILNITNPVGGAWNMTLPATAGSNGQVMQTNGSGLMTWTTPLTSATGFLNGGNSFGANASLGTNDAFRLDVKTNNSPRMTVDSAGNVGIGTTAPASRLELVIPSAHSGAEVLQFDNNDGTPLAGFFDENWGTTPVHPSGFYNLNAVFGFAIGAANGPLILGSGGDGASWVSERMRITTAGNVGIGTTAPASLLDVNGTIDLKGLNGIRYLANDTTAGASIAIGDQALQGMDALASAAYGNLAIGRQALGGALTSSATGNLAIGNTALSSLTTGNTNLAIGAGALAADTTGGGNVAIGKGALSLDTTGGTNVAIGPGALQNGSAPSSNVAIGQMALISNSASQNVAIGTMSSWSNSTGQGNVTLGASSMFNHQGNYNIAIGASSLLTAGSSDNNIAMGLWSGYQITSGAANVIIGGGEFIGGVTTGSNNVILGYQARPASATASNQLSIGNLIYGTGLAQAGTLSTGKIGIGVMAPATTLEVAGTLKIGDGGETCGASYAGGVRYNGGNVQFCNGTSWSTLGVAGAGITALTGDVTASGAGSVAATVATVGTSTAADVHTAELLANAATSVNTNSAIVRRDASGNFASNVVTANGLSLNNAGSALNIVNPVGGAWNMTLPATAGLNGQVMQTNGSGVMSWMTPVPAAIGFVNGGNTFGANASIGTTDAYRLDIKTNNAVAMTVDSAGKVGIGTTAPGGIFEVQGGTAAASTNGTNITLAAQNGGAGNQNGGWIRLQPGLGTGTGTRGRVQAAGSLYQSGTNLQLILSNTISNTASQSNFYNYALVANFPALNSTFMAAENTAELSTSSVSNSTTIMGSANTAKISNTGGTTVQNVTGGQFTVVNNEGSSGTVAVAKAGEFQISRTAPITNGYGVYVGTIDATNKYSVYANDATAPSYFAGNVGIGTTSPQATLEVAGDVKAEHILGRTAAPTGSLVSSAAIYGTGATISVTGSDSAFLVTFNSGTGISSPGNVFNVLFTRAYASAPSCVFSAGNSAAASAATNVFLMTYTGSLTFADSSPLTSSTTYKWYFNCIQ